MSDESRGKNSAYRAFSLGQANVGLPDILNCSFMPHVLQEINDCWEVNEERARRYVRKEYHYLDFVDSFIGVQECQIVHSKYVQFIISQ